MNFLILTAAITSFGGTNCWAGDTDLPFVINEAMKFCPACYKGRGRRTKYASESGLPAWSVTPRGGNREHIGAFLERLARVERERDRLRLVGDTGPTDRPVTENAWPFDAN